MTYFLADDTLSIFEPPQRNTGLNGGKFLERRRLKKPTSAPLPFAAYSRTISNLTQRPISAPSDTLYNSGSYSPTLRPSTTAGTLSPIRGRTSPSPVSPSRSPNLGRTASPSPPTSPGGTGTFPGIDGEYYAATDMFIGGVVECHKHKFVLQDASKYAFEFMEANPADFPYANLRYYPSPQCAMVTVHPDRARPKMIHYRDQYRQTGQFFPPFEKLRHKKDIFTHFIAYCPGPAGSVWSESQFGF